MDNTSDVTKSIDSYFVSNLSAGYTFKKSAIGFFNLQVFVNNPFNREYVANGWAATDTLPTAAAYIGLVIIPSHPQLHDATHSFI